MLDFVQWFVPGRVMLVQFSDILMFDDVQQMNSQALLLMSEALPPHIHVIVDGERVTKFSPELMNIRNLRGMLYTDAVVIWHIIVDPDPNPAMRFIGSMVFNLMGARLRVCPTIDAAMAFLQSWESEQLKRTDGSN